MQLICSDTVTSLDEVLTILWRHLPLMLQLQSPRYHTADMGSEDDGACILYPNTYLVAEGTKDLCS